MSFNLIERSKPTGGGSIQCLRRAMELLDRLADAPQQRLRDLAAGAGLGTTTAHNILRTLADGGYVVNDAGRYSIGPAAARLGMCWAPLQALPELVTPAMMKMSRDTGESGFLGVLLAGRCELVPVSQGTAEVTVRATQRTTHLPLAVATGRLLAAFAPDAQAEAIITAYVQERPDRPADAWRRDLAAVRHSGQVILRRKDGADAVAVPLRGAGGSVLASLGASCPHFRGTPRHLQHMLESLTRAAAEAGSRLGFSGEHA